MADRRSGAGAAGSAVRRQPEVVHVGAASRDVTEEDPRGWRLGGGVTYSALTTARLGLRTAAVVGVDPQASAAQELDLLRAAGVELRLVPLEHGPIFHNLETPTGRVQTCLDPGVALPVPPVPDAWAAASAWVIAPVAGEVGEGWLAAVPAGAFLAVGWQGLLRVLAPGERVARRPPGSSRLIRRADLVGVSHHDVDPETRLETLAALLRPGARLLVTQGREGGLLVAAVAGGIDSVLRYRPIRASREVDPTGAGDAFLAALVATVVRPGLGAAGSQRGELDLGFAAAAGSLVVEAPGLAGVPDRAAVLERFAGDEGVPSALPSRADRVGSRGEG
jgi:sugar/nucleoside kinase (ribokinase family)